ncbi:MAG: N-acetyltransferase, partial [Pseudomonadota bacterium]
MTIIREAERTDHHAIVAMYPDVFPDEDLVPLVNNLHAQAEGLVSLVAVAASGQVIGHISLTRCSVSDFDIPVYLLGPLAVSPSHQRSGHGRALIEAGLDRVRALGASQIYVLGDPVYYSRV